MISTIIWWTTLVVLFLCIVALLIQMRSVNREVDEMCEMYKVLEARRKALDEEKYILDKRSKFLDESIIKVKKMHDNVK